MIKRKPVKQIPESMIKKMSRKKNASVKKLQNFTMQKIVTPLTLFKRKPQNGSRRTTEESMQVNIKTETEDSDFIQQFEPKAYNVKQVKLEIEPDWVDKHHMKDGVSDEMVSYAMKMHDEKAEIDEKTRRHE